MNNQDKSKEDLVKELQELKQAHDALKASYEEDINKRKQVEEALSQSESNYRLLAQNSSDVIWTLNNDYRFTYVSPSIYHLRGLTSEEAMCETIQETMTPRSQQIVYEAIVKGKKNEEAKIYLPVRVEIEQYHKDGHKIWVEISLRAMLDDQGKHVGYVGISRNATQRKMAEKALRKSEAKLREINAQKDKFFSIIAHDLKSPFNAILGFSDLLLDQVDEKDYAGIEEYAAMIKQASQRTLDLLMNLLEWSRAQTGRMLFDPANFELVSFIEENILLFDAIADQKAIAIHTVFPDEITVFADKAMVGTALRNLISNAIKFTRQGGEINISAEKKSKEILIQVADNGIGIAPGRLERLFRIDESDSTSGTNNEKGTGLGLILCKEFVENHGGKIWAESEEGKGSAFYFTLSCNAN